MHTHERLLTEETYLPLGTTAHKQGRVAGENVLGGTAEFAGSLGTQSVKIFGQGAAPPDSASEPPVRLGSTRHRPGGCGRPQGVLPSATPLWVRLTGDRSTGRPLGTHGAEVAKRIDALAAATYNANTVAPVSEMDLSYTPPLNAPWDPIQQAAQHWVKKHRRIR